MAPRVWEEQLVATFVASGGVSDPSAPTAAEVAAGTDYSSYIMKGDISWPSGRGTVDTATIDVKQNTSYPGGESGTLDLKYLAANRDGLVAAHTEFADGEVEGYWVFGFEGSNDTAADVVTVMHVVGDRPNPNNPGRDEVQKYMVHFHLQDKVYADVSVVA